MNTKDTSFKLATGLHRAVFTASKGRVANRIVGLPVVKLVTTGRRSGRPRAAMLAVPLVEGDRLVLVASFSGDDRHPMWFLNLRANPRVRATFAGSIRTMTARVATREERDRLWPRITAAYQGYARYQQRTSREIPVVVLEPR